MRHFIYCIIAVLLSNSVMARQKKDVNLSLEFIFDFELNKQYMWRHFVPVTEKAIAYRKDGSPFTLSMSDTIMVTGAERGSYDGHQGIWLKPAGNNQNDLYIFLDDQIKEVTDEARNNNQAAFDHRVNERLKTVGYASIPFLIFAMIAALVSPKRVKLPDFIHKKIKSTTIS